MCPENETAAPAEAEHSTLYVAIVISQGWVGVQAPDQKEDRAALAQASGQVRPQGSDRDPACQG